MAMHGKCSLCTHCILTDAGFVSTCNALNKLDISERERKRRIEVAYRNAVAECIVTGKIIRPGYNCNCGKFYLDHSKVSGKEFDDFLRKLEIDKKRNPQDYEEAQEISEDSEVPVTKVDKKSKQRKPKERPESFASKGKLAKFIVCVVSAVLIITACILGISLVAMSGGPSKEISIPFIGVGISLLVIFTIIDLLFFRNVAFIITGKINDLYHNVSDAIGEALDIGFTVVSPIYWLARVLLWITYPFVQFLVLLVPSPIVFSVGLSEDSSYEQTLRLGLGLMMSFLYGTFFYFIFTPIIVNQLVSILISVVISSTAFALCANPEVMLKIAYIGLCVSKYPYKACDAAGNKLTKSIWTFLIGLLFLPLCLVFMILQPFTAIAAVIICGPFVFVVYLIKLIIQIIINIKDHRSEVCE